MDKEVPLGMTLLSPQVYTLRLKINIFFTARILLALLYFNSFRYFPYGTLKKTEDQ